MELLCPACCSVYRVEIPDSSEVLCSWCWSELRENLQVPFCPTCGLPAGPYELIDDRCHCCQKSRSDIWRVARLGQYDGVLRDLILSFKYRRQSRLDMFLGEMLASAIIGDPKLSNVDLLVPVPLHWFRRLARGYNQAEILARAIAKNLKIQGFRIPVNCDLVRVRNTVPQVQLPASQRKKNLIGAFAARPDADYRDKHICLIDDVTTTGTTLTVAAKALKKAGAGKISAAVLTVAADD